MNTGMNTEERAAEIARLHRRLTVARRVLEHPERHPTAVLDLARQVVQQDGETYTRLAVEQIGEAIKPVADAIVETFNKHVVPAFAAFGKQLVAAFTQAKPTIEHVLAEAPIVEGSLAEPESELPGT